MPKKSSKKAEEPQYNMNLVMGTQKYHAHSNDVTEAILALKPEKITTRALFTLEYNGKTSSFIRNVGRTRRIFSNNLTARILGRNLVMRLK
jgi:hypothetical protein